ncbi:RpiB/LacA/LacB family sugar-phosphate isomerase [Candidatus Saccharibacteria bacterium]|nr:RpiB/LacA/LacB family sugar-phosphate isomerase [Candidatus Saccharibacteria bacterium]
MQLYVASDHRGFTVKQRLLTFLAEYRNQHPEMNIEVTDLGPLTIQPGDDFNDSAIVVSRAVRENPTARGFLICGSAPGMSIQANRFRGIRAICGYTESLSRIGRKHNDSNVL